MTSLIAGTASLSAYGVTLALAFYTLAGWSPAAETTSAAETSMGVVDAFIDARAARDVAATSNLLDERLRIVDTSRELSAGPDAFHQVLPPGTTREFGTRTRAGDGSITWTETAVDDGRPSWEHNLNWWMDDTVPVELDRTPPATTYTRQMRAVIVDAKIVQLIVVRMDPPVQAHAASSV